MSDLKWLPHNSLKLRYSGPTLAILHAIDIDGVTRVLVVGDPANGAYEWAIERNGKIEKHSDVGYGISFVALRDGLIQYWDLPHDAPLPPDHEVLLALRSLIEGNRGVCLFDRLNPCWDGRPTDVPGKHWGKGPACSVCNARALVAKHSPKVPA